MEAEDFLQMCSIVQGFSKELDDPGELDIFINNMKHSSFVQHITRDERLQRTMIHKHQGDQLLETLNSVLRMPDCPARLEATSTSRPVRALTTPTREATSGIRTSQIPRLCPQCNARLNVTGAASPTSAGTSGSGSGGADSSSAGRNDSEECYDYDQGVPEDAAAEPFTNCDEACLNLLQIEVPNQEETPNNLLCLIVMAERCMRSETTQMLHMHSIVLYVEGTIALRTALP